MNGSRLAPSKDGIQFTFRSTTYQQLQEPAESLGDLGLFHKEDQVTIKTASETLPYPDQRNVLFDSSPSYVSEVTFSSDSRQSDSRRQHRHSNAKNGNMNSLGVPI